MSATSIQAGEYPAARVRHTEHGYGATMTWGHDCKATARTSYDHAARECERVLEAAWKVRDNLGARLLAGRDPGEYVEFTNRDSYVVVVGSVAPGEYVATFIPSDMAGAAS